MTKDPGGAPPRISVIVPAHDAAATLARCLTALRASALEHDELIVVDDGSGDDSARIAQEVSHQVVRLAACRGAGAARNAGARVATGSILLFIDADVVVSPDILQQVRHDLTSHPEVVAVQGVYRSPGLVESAPSRYQNDYYHYALCRVPGDYTSVFATWCGAVYREAFWEAGGFDERIPGATVEDEEFGYALVDKGFLVLLDRELLVDHLADYSLSGLLSRRFRMGRSQMKSALRNVRLRLLRRYANVGRNLTHHSRRVIMAIPVSFAILVALLLTVFMRRSALLIAFLGCWVLLAALAAGFLLHVAKVQGWRAVPASMGLFWLDMLSVGCGLAVGAGEYLAGRKF